jgi:mRNA interferase RelE/StbE
LEIEWHPDAAKELAALDVAVQRRIVRTLKEKVLQASDPVLEPYHGDLKGFHKLRIGPYRLVCRVQGREQRTLLVLVVGHRSEVYLRRRKGGAARRLQEF